MRLFIALTHRKGMAIAINYFGYEILISRGGTFRLLLSSFVSIFAPQRSLLSVLNNNS